MTARATQSQYGLGVMLVVVSAITFSTAGLFSKGVSAAPWDIIFWRGVFSAGFTTLWVWYRGQVRDNFAKMGISGIAVAIVGALGTAAFIAAFKLTTIANVSMIYATAPMLAAQLGIAPEDLTDYAHRAETRREHLADLREIYGYKMFSGQGARDLKAWLTLEAETARSSLDLARRFVEQCRHTHTVLPGVSVVERLCADALVVSERKIDSRIADRLGEAMQFQLDALLTELVDERVSRFVWLRQFEVGQNSAGASRLLDRLDFLQAIEVPAEILDDVPPHRIARLRRQGERYFADGLRDISSDRRLAILSLIIHKAA